MINGLLMLTVDRISNCIILDVSLGFSINRPDRSRLEEVSIATMGMSHNSFALLA